MSVVKRVRKLLDLANRRGTGKISLEHKSSEAQMLHALGEEQERHRRNEGEEILLRGTGRAIEKTLGFALYFSGQDDTTVRIGTGTVAVVDDIIEKERSSEEDLMEVDAQSGADIPETQVRRTSMLEVGIRSR